MVKRSNGSESEGFVIAYDEKKKVYKLGLGAMDSKETKMAREKDIRPAA